MATTVKVNLDSVSKILSKRKLEPNGEAQRFMTSEIKRLSDPYTPFRDGGLKDKQCVVTANQIQYNSPYARAMWHGKVMAGNPRKPTNKNISFSGAPKRGKEWTNRMMADRRKDVVNAVAKFIGARSE